MRIDHSKTVTIAVFSIIPDVAHAQHIPTWLFVSALSPFAVLLMAIILGILTRSWKVGAVNVGLVLFWVLLFGLASYFVENDYVIWTPLVLYAVHALTVLALIVLNIVRRLVARP